MWARCPCPTEAPAHLAPDTAVFVFNGPWPCDENEQGRRYLNPHQQVSLLIGFLTAVIRALGLTVSEVGPTKRNTEQESQSPGRAQHPFPASLFISTCEKHGG